MLIQMSVQNVMKVSLIAMTLMFVGYVGSYGYLRKKRRLVRNETNYYLQNVLSKEKRRSCMVTDIGAMKVCYFETGRRKKAAQKRIAFGNRCKKIFWPLMWAELLVRGKMRPEKWAISLGYTHYQWDSKYHAAVVYRDTPDRPQPVPTTAVVTSSQIAQSDDLPVSLSGVLNQQGNN